MKNVFVWLTDINQYAIDNNLAYGDVVQCLLNVAKEQGYDCRESFERDACKATPMERISIEVDEIDGLCMSARVISSQSHHKHITVADWLNWK